MRHRESKGYIKFVLFNKFTGLIVVSFCLIGFFTFPAPAKTETAESPEDVITVENYKWVPGGSGTAAIVKELTLNNKGKTNYKNIRVEVDFYSGNDIPLGSLRTTIKDEIPAGSKKTFYNINFGLLHSELEKTSFRVIKAETIRPEGVASTAPADVIAVKNWEWTGGRYATEGILKEITLENKSATNYKDIELVLVYTDGSGSTLSAERTVIRDVLPANGEKAFYNINAGFRHPDALETAISVLDASPVSAKKLRPVLVGKKVRKPGRRLTQEEIEEIGIKVSKRQTKITGSPKTPDEKTVEEAESGSANAAELSEGDVAVIYPEQDEYVYEYEDEEPVPDVDIVVRDFKMGGGNITGTIGVLEELTLENTSGITYGNIRLNVDFYARSDKRPVGSNKITISEVLPANSEKVFRDVKIGFLNFIPEDVEISVVDARVVR